MNSTAREPNRTEPSRAETGSQRNGMKSNMFWSVCYAIACNQFTNVDIIVSIHLNETYTLTHTHNCMRTELMVE